MKRIRSENQNAFDQERDQSSNVKDEYFFRYLVIEVSPKQVHDVWMSKEIAICMQEDAPVDILRFYKEKVQVASETKGVYYLHKLSL